MASNPARTAHPKSPKPTTRRSRPGRANIPCPADATSTAESRPRTLSHRSVLHRLPVFTYKTKGHISFVTCDCRNPALGFGVDKSCLSAIRDQIEHRMLALDPHSGCTECCMINDAQPRVSLLTWMTGFHLSRSSLTGEYHPHSLNNKRTALQPTRSSHYSQRLVNMPFWKLPKAKRGNQSMSEDHCTVSLHSVSFPRCPVSIAIPVLHIHILLRSLRGSIPGHQRNTHMIL